MAKESSAAILEVNTDSIISSEKEVIEDLQPHLANSNSGYHDVRI